MKTSRSDNHIFTSSEREAFKYLLTKVKAEQICFVKGKATSVLLMPGDEVNVLGEYIEEPDGKVSVRPMAIVLNPKLLELLMPAEPQARVVQNSEPDDLPPPGNR